MFRVLIGCFVTFLWFTSAAQQAQFEAVMSYRELIDSITNSNLNRVFFSGVKFEYQPPVDKEFIKIWPSGIKEINYWGLWIQNMTFQVGISFADCEFTGPNSASIKVVGGHFHSLEFADCQGLGWIFDSCTFEGDLVYGGGKCSEFDALNCVFKRTFSTRHATIGGISLENNVFLKTQYHNFDQLPSLYFLWNVLDPVPLWIVNSEIEDVTIGHQDFTVPNQDTIPSITLLGNTIKRLSLTNDTIGILSLKDNVISKSASFDSVRILKSVYVEGVDLPGRSTNISWDILKGNKICVLAGKHAYKGITNEDLKDTYAFQNLMSEYNKFFQLYKTRGDIESANGCYVELKDLETQRLQYLYTNGQLNNAWFKWQLNKFLKFFCDYGTNPARALVIAFRTVLLFALLYFFFYSNWDRISRSFLIRQHRKILGYFSSEQSMEDFYTESYKAELQPYIEYQRELHESRTKVPYFMFLLGKPLYRLSVMRHHLMGWLYRKTEILQGRWIDLPPKRRLFAGFVVSTAAVCYILYLIVIRALNSVMLSLNTFSTLGFGEIPVKGISRYAAIVEGFLGWFLLSIFSVSLISQILQV